MLRPLGKNVLLRKYQEENRIIIMNEDTNKYEVLAIGNEIKDNLVGKIVFVDKFVKKLDYQNETYYVACIDDIYLVEEK